MPAKIGFSMKKQNNKYKLVPVAILFILILVVIANLNGYHFLSLVEGVKVLGLSNIGVVSNYQGYVSNTGWWIATVGLGGGQTLNVNSKAFSQANSSYICNSQCQNNNVQFTTDYSYLEYDAKGSGLPFNIYNITYLSYGQKSLSYDTCYGSLTGANNPTTTSTGSPISFGGCLIGMGGADINYVNACSAAGGIPLVQGGYLSGTWGCYAIVGTPYAYGYQLNSPKFRWQVTVSINGQSSTINDSQASVNSNPNLILFNDGSVYSSQQAPSPQTYLVQFKSNNTVLQAVGTAPNVQTLISGYNSTLTTCIDNIVNAESGSSAGYTLPEVHGCLTTADSNVRSAILTNVGNTQFANSTLIYSSSSPISSNQGDVVGVKLNDPTMLYTTPLITLLIKANDVGLYLGVSNFSLSSPSISSFRSMASGSAYVTVTNAGQAAGGFIVTPSGTNGDTFTPSSFSGYLNAGNSQTAIFTVNNNNDITSNTTISDTFTVCPNPNPNGASACHSISASHTLVPACTNNTQFNQGNCQALPQPSIPTTSLPNGGGGGTSTIMLCNGNTGQGCSGTPTTPIPYTLIIILMFIAIIVYWLINRNKPRNGYSSSTRRKSVGASGIKLSNNQITLLIVGVIIAILIFSGWFWIILILAFVLAIITIVLKLLFRI